MHLTPMPTSAPIQPTRRPARAQGEFLDNAARGYSTGRTISDLFSPSQPDRVGDAADLYLLQKSAQSGKKDDFATAAARGRVWGKILFGN